MTACSGALVRPRWVLPAWHCLADARATRYARVGGVRPDGPAVLVVERHRYPSEDLGLARLARPVTSVEPLRALDRPPVPGESVRAAGWGLSGTVEEVTMLRTGHVVVSRVEDFAVLTAPGGPAGATQLCKGDSGAPLFVEGPAGPRLVAVESRGGSSCSGAGAGLAVRVDNARDWISATTGLPEQRSLAERARSRVVLR